MKNTLLFSLLLCTALSCSGNGTTNSTSDSDSLNSEGTPDPARVTDDEPEEVDYMLVCGSDGVPPVYLFADEKDQQIIYWRASASVSVSVRNSCPRRTRTTGRRA